ncbi:hypothetical protein TorRG33x02_073300 [Trema orientale]|uniref:Uncharacterized protein n=1 Tax=Trema orientale TaxID=63057 RepID=A0A2P5FGN1_TREOI|nr:hypothetical protein TorRG33x02_073300 [Trema orientale]
MSLNANYANSNLGSAFHFKPYNHSRFFPKSPFQIREFLVYCRRRLERSRKFKLRSQLGRLKNYFRP